MRRRRQPATRARSATGCSQRPPRRRLHRPAARRAPRGARRARRARRRSVADVAGRPRRRRPRGDRRAGRRGARRRATTARAAGRPRPGRRQRRLRRDRPRGPGAASARSCASRAPTACAWSGPTAWGIVNTDPAVRLNAALAPDAAAAAAGSGFFAQSGALGVALLETGAAAATRACPPSSRPATAPTSRGNDLLQYWADRPATEVVLLLPGELRQPAQVRPARPRLGASQAGGRREERRHVGVTACRPATPSAAVPEQSVDGAVRPAGVIRVETVPQLFDVGSCWRTSRCRPVAGGVVGQLDGHRLRWSPTPCLEQGPRAGPRPDPVRHRRRRRRRSSAPRCRPPSTTTGVDAVVAGLPPAPRWRLDDEFGGRRSPRRRGRRARPAGPSSDGPAHGMLRRLRAEHGVRPRGRCRRTRPPRSAVLALATVHEYARWRRATPVPRVDPPGPTRPRARRLVAGGAGRHPDGARADRRRLAARCSAPTASRCARRCEVDRPGGRRAGRRDGSATPWCSRPRRPGCGTAPTSAGCGSTSPTRRSCPTTSSR